MFRMGLHTEHVVSRSGPAHIPHPPPGGRDEGGKIMKSKSLNKVFVVLLSLVLIIALLPTTAFAAGSTTITKKMSFQQLWRIRKPQKFILQAT